jgi:AcrR family transcriptional regulator
MRADSRETVNELLNVAERLFAKHGVEHVALTRIVASSGQKNRSALHYHFGSREGLLAAVLDRRLKHINALRHGMLEEVVGSAGLAGIVRAFVTPLGSVVVNEPWGPDYVSILAQVRFHPRLLGKRSLDDASLSSIRRCRRLIEQALPEIPRPVLLRRLGWFTDSVALAIARWAHETPKSSRTHNGMRDLNESLVSYGVAGLSAWPREGDRAGGKVVHHHAS